jgi:membrane fusion protein (multidrug efflux system)
VIASRAVQGGDRVGDGDPLFRLVNTADLEFEATVPSEYAGRVKVGSPVGLTVAGAGDARIAGEVARVNATADPATRQVKVYVVVHNRDGALVGDLFASGRIVLARVPGALAIPAAGVRGAGDDRYAWVVKNRRIERRAVTPGLQDEVADRIEIRRGLQAGDTVIVGPVEGLKAGQTVKISGVEG